MKYSIIPPIRPIDNMEMVDKVVERFAAVRERVGKRSISRSTSTAA